MSNTQPNLGPLLAVVTRQREEAMNKAAEHEAHAFVLAQQNTALRKQVDELTQKIAEMSADHAEPPPDLGRPALKLTDQLARA